MVPSTQPLIVLLTLLSLLSASCNERSVVDIAGNDLGPSDDPNAYAVDTEVTYTVTVSEPRWVVPSNTLLHRRSPQLPSRRTSFGFQR